ncbi:MAG: acyl carrier protein [Bacteroidetes bacterium]|nr:acyl carrier protein [Bacteroidota bacterium]
MKEVESKVKKIIAEKLGIDEAEIKNDSSFIEDLGADSLDTVELVMEFENVFGVTVSDDIVESINTVGDIIEYIKKRAEETEPK